MSSSLIILLLVYITIAMRRILFKKIQIWQILLLGSLAVIICKQISLVDAFHSIDFEILLFLLGMFIVGGFLEEIDAFSKFKQTSFSSQKVFVIIVFFMGLLSAIFLNDTIAVIGTPLVIYMAKKNKLPVETLLFALCFAITIGSVFSPIGNPQNFLIASKGDLTSPILVFLKYLFAPTLLNLGILYFWMRRVSKKTIKKGGLAKLEELHSSTSSSLSSLTSNRSSSKSRSEKPRQVPKHPTKVLEDVMKKSYLDKKVKLEKSKPSLKSKGKSTKGDRVNGISTPFISSISMVQIVSIGCIIILLVIFRCKFDFALYWIGLLPAILITLFKKDRKAYLRHIDWQTLVLFAALFVLMKSVWMTSDLKGFSENVPKTPGIVLLIGFFVSQVISNVPMVYLFLPFLKFAQEVNFMALAAGSTIAGNFMLFGAASNLIVFSIYERKMKSHLSLFRFSLIGIPLSIVNLAIYYGYFYLVGV